MNNLLYLMAVVLTLAWVIGLLALNASGLIHLLLVIALLAVIVGVLKGKEAA